MATSVLTPHSTDFMISVRNTKLHILKHYPNATQITFLKVFVRECDPFSLLEGTDVSPRLSVKGCAYVELEEDNRNEQILSY